jgi:hypothetical protein
LAWPWKSKAHINELEVSSAITALRRRSRSAARHGERVLLILDSTVAVGVLAKGRSSSKRLNRLCRRAAAIVLAADQYPVYTWTISGWNFADRPSRRVHPRADAAA